MLFFIYMYAKLTSGVQKLIPKVDNIHGNLPSFVGVRMSEIMK